MSKFFKHINKGISSFFMSFWKRQSNISNRRFIATTWHTYLIIALILEQVAKMPTPDKLFLSSMTAVIWGFYFTKGPHIDKMEKRDEK